MTLSGFLLCHLTAQQDGANGHGQRACEFASPAQGFQDFRGQL
jgi:hypothetical protein